MTNEALFQQALIKSVFLLTKRGMSELFVNTFFLNLLNKIISLLRLNRIFLCNLERIMLK